MTYDLDRTILELEAEARNADPAERRQIEAELRSARTAASAPSRPSREGFLIEPQSESISQASANIADFRVFDGGQRNGAKHSYPYSHVIRIGFMCSHGYVERTNSR